MKNYKDYHELNHLSDCKKRENFYWIWEELFYSFIISQLMILNTEITETKMYECFEYFYIISFLLSSIYLRGKYLIRENFRLPVFDGFTCFEMS